MTPPTPDILTRYLANTCTDDERRQVETWYDTFDRQPDLFNMYPETQQATYQHELFRRVQAVIPQRTNAGYSAMAVAKTLALCGSGFVGRDYPANRLVVPACGAGTGYERSGRHSP